MHPEKDESSFDPSCIPQEVWVDLILSNDFSFGDLLHFGLVCRYLSGILSKPKIQNLQFTRKKTSIYQGNAENLIDLCWSPDGVLIATASWARIIGLWNTRTGKEIQQFIGHDDTIYSVHFHPSERIIASGGLDHTVRLWDIPSGQQLLKIQCEKNVLCVRFSSDAKHLAACVGHSILLHDPQSGALKKTLKGHLQCVRSVHFDQFRPNVLFSHDDDDHIFIWDIDTGEPQKEFKGHTSSMSSFALSIDHTLLATFGFHGIVIYDLVKEEVAQRFELILGGNGCISEDAQHIFYHLGRSIAVLDRKSGSRTNSLNGHQSTIRFIAISPDRKFLASCSNDSTLRVWDLKNFC